MRFPLTVLIFLATACATAPVAPAPAPVPAPTPAPPPPKGGPTNVQGQTTAADTTVDDRLFRFGVAGSFYAALQNWPDVGAADDPKFGFGLGGSLGVSMTIDDMRVTVGPHLGYNMWTADYSQKPSSATQSVTIAMGDVGLEMALKMDDIVIYLGKGTSEMEAFMILDNGDKVFYPGLNGEEFDYNTVGFGFVFRKFTLGILHTSYDGGASDASRAEVRFSFGR